jgi:2-keto-3-deoxy-L-rhamnonate aldolase RhmA
MSGRKVKEKLARGETVFGMFFQYLTNPAVVDILPETGIDFVIVNDEHNALDMGDFLGIQYALRSKGIACLIRICDQDPARVAKACDAFPDGVVVPYIEDPNLIRKLVAAAKYRPLKGQALEKLIQSRQWPSDKTRNWCKEKCADTLFCGMIESVAGIENLGKICQISGIDALFVGPNDLTVSMGIPEERDHPSFLAALKKVFDTAERHGIAAGAHLSVPEQAKQIIEMGARFVPYSSDLRILRSGTEEAFSKLSKFAASAKRKAARR